LIINFKKALKNINFFPTVKATKYVLGYMWKEKDGKKYILGRFITSIFNAFFPYIYMVFPGLIINELMGEQQLKRLLLYVGILSITPFIQQLINYFVDKKLHSISLLLSMKFESYFFNYTLSMDFETLEQPDIQILKDRADETIHDIINITNQLSGLFTALLSLLVISSVISSLSPIVLIIIVIVISINSFAIKRADKEDFNLRKALTKHALFQSAYLYMMDKFEFAKEIRLFNIKELLINTLMNSKKNSNLVEEEIHRNRSRQNIVTAATSLIQQILVYIYLIYNVIFRNLALGTMTIYLSAIGNFSNRLSGVMRAYLNISAKTEKTNEFISFMNIPNKQLSTGRKIPIFDESSVIEFENVSFKYPGSDVYAIKDLSLKIYGNQKVCIVGENGSGKSTFIKLLIRLYTPTKGRILLNNIDIYEYDYNAYQRLFAPVFQDYAHLLMTIRKNIVLSNLDDQQKLDKISFDCGLSPLISKLPKGYDSQVGKWIDEEGFNPSGGEGQKMAIARAVYHDANIYLLDEPTAALDPFAENEIYTQFGNMVKNRCAIIITHRLSAVQLGDKIMVFREGSLAEYGTHKELYEKGGIYTEMFDKQAQFYRDETPNEN